MLYGGAV
jgi:hypothetical protein